MKLARKIIVVTLAVFLTLLGVVSYIEVGRAVRVYRNLVRSELAVTGHALRPAIRELVETEGEPQAVRLLQKTDATMSTVNLRWASFHDPESTPFLQADQRAALEDGGEVSLDRADRLYAYVPVGKRGAIEVAQALTEERSVAVLITQDRLVAALIAILGAAAVATIFGLRYVGRPMAILAEHARRVGAGDLTRRLSLDRTDEIGELASEMNGMCDRLMAAQASAAKEAQARLKAVEQLRHVDRLRTVGTLASGIAHELGTPLSVIAGRAKMIAGPDTSKEQVAQYSQVIQSQVNRMSEIVRGLLDFARRRPANKTRADLRDVTRRALDLLSPLAKRNGVALTLATDGGDATAEVDAVQVEQAVANLVVNAIQAMPKGGEVLIDAKRVRAKAPEADDESEYVCVAVKDGGAGIAPADLPRVFEPFFTTKDLGEGTGLGLSVTYGIVQEHSGFAEVTSELGQGSCFQLFFPAEGIA